MFRSTRKSPHTSLYIDFQRGRPHQILFTSRGSAVLYTGELIHTALKYVQRGEKWGVRSSLCVLLQIGSNFVPLMFLPLSPFLFLHLSSATEAGAHYPPEVWCATSVFQSMWWWQRRRRGRDEFSVLATEEVGALIPPFFKTPGALGTSHAVLFNARCQFKGNGFRHRKENVNILVTKNMTVNCTEVSSKIFHWCHTIEMLAAFSPVLPPRPSPTSRCEGQGTDI